MIEELGLDKLKELMEDVYGKKFNSSGELQLFHGEFNEFELLNNNKYAFFLLLNRLCPSLSKRDAPDK